MSRSHPIHCEVSIAEVVTVLPLYGGISPRLMRGFRSCVCRMSFTRSMGATAVFAIAPAMPPASRSLKNSLVTFWGAATAPLLMSPSFAEGIRMLGLAGKPLSGATILRESCTMLQELACNLEAFILYYSGLNCAHWTHELM